MVTGCGSWLQYTKAQIDVLNYKTTLKESEPFKILSFLHGGDSSTILEVKKKKNTMDLYQYQKKKKIY